MYRILEKKQAVRFVFIKGSRKVLVLYQNKLVLEQRNGQTFFFHPDTAMLRIKAGHDPLLDLIGPSKKTILDCTMGLASIVSY